MESSDTDRRPTTGAANSTAERKRPSLLKLLRLRDDTAMPMYQQLERQLTALIEDGSIAPGTTLPAERQLAEKLGVSRVTVQRSYNGLRLRKLLSAHGRLGSIVQENPHRLDPGMDRLKGFTQEMQALGRVASSKILEQKVVKDRSIASIFGLPSTAQFLKLVRIRYGDDVPLSHEVAWYDVTAVPGLGKIEPTHSVYARLAECGAPLSYCEQAIEAASPSAKECKIFGFTEPVPCLLIKRRSFTRDGRMVEYVEGLFRGDLYAYRLKLKV
jgi:GntR family transcriptional regulator